MPARQQPKKNIHSKKATLMNKFRLYLLALGSLLAAPLAATAVTINLVDDDDAPVSGFRWLAEKDTTTVTVPGALVSDSIALAIHQSYAPVLTNGQTAGNSAEINLPDGRYIISVLPHSGYTLGAAIVTNNQASATIVVHAHPVPTAQISILVFEDHHPINNIFDAEETGLAGFKIMVGDATGGGPLSTDAFGNPLGTTYLQDGNGNYLTDADGNYIVQTMGNGVITTDTNGVALVRFLAPGKYGIQIVPPAGTNWVQTSTIEGTPTIDAWVKANEPAVFLEGFGGGFKHCVFGFVDPARLAWATNPPPVSAANTTIRGKLVYNHFSKPPKTQGFFPGAAVPDGWIGLNNTLEPLQGLYAAECAADSTFVITNVPPGTYQLVSWDTPLDAIFGFNTVTVTNGADINLGNVLCFRWFSDLEGSIFYDTNQNGFPDAGETGIGLQTLNLRFRDGSLYQTTTTAPDGSYKFSEVFPFFKWLVAEVDFARYKATGLTAIVDDGGEVPPDNGWTMPSRNMLTPQPQIDMETNSATYGEPIINPNTGNNLSRTETGPVLLQAAMLFLNQFCVIDWGKTDYQTGENGGISGIIYYNTTRAENDPTDAVGDPWEPGIPRVPVNLYADSDNNGVIDDLNADGRVTLADVDHYPFGWQSGGAKGPEDIDRNTNSVFDPGDALNITQSDSWDDSPPQGSVMTNIPVIHGQRVTPGFDGFGTWNQIRPGVFDGGYAFASYFPGGMANNTNEVDGLPTGTYIVEAVAPPGYLHFKSQDKNVDFGDSYVPQQANIVPPLGNPVCVGEPYIVPAELALFPGLPAPLAGQTLRMPDRKQVQLPDRQNAAANFFLFTEVPKAARAVGFVNNDLAAEFDPTSPVFGEKAAPAWLPVAFQDYTGQEIVRVYTDEFGGYNAMLPSTYTINVPEPSGVAPNMLTLVINKPTRPDPNHPGQEILDPFYDPNYSVTPWTFHYLPARTTYLDTPIVPLAAYVGDRYRKLDVEAADRTPIIFSATGPSGGAIIESAADILTITALGNTIVPNPDYYVTTTGSVPAYITRDFGFGAIPGTVTLGQAPLNIISWNAAIIQATAPAGTPSGQLMVRRGDNGRLTPMGVTLTAFESGATVRHVYPASYPAHPIQDAIDAAAAGDLILVHAGTYDENPIMWKPVRLQGGGAPATLINANPAPTERATAWHAKVRALLGTPTDPFAASECPGVLALGSVAGAAFTGQQCRIDGFTLYGSLMGGGVYVYQNIQGLRIGNNRIHANQGEFAGGIGAGMPNDGRPDNNAGLVVHDNFITKNAGISGGGGLAFFDNCPNYLVTNNFICGNLTRGNGAGICHQGLSTNGLIINNRIIANEVFYGANVGGEGGGIYLAGETAPAGQLSAGAGTVTIAGNLIQGNMAGGQHGGGVRANRFNGQDVVNNPGATNNALWHALYLFNNIIVNNVAGLGGGGVSLQDVARGFILNCTIANNDSTATGRLAFEPGALNSTPQGAGIVGQAHSAAITNASGQNYSDPLLADCIIWHNRSFYNKASFNNGAGGLATNTLHPYWDLNARVANASLHPLACLLSDPSGYDASNYTASPRFNASYVNRLSSATVLDEAGNSISIKMNPIGIRGDYHLKSDSGAIGRSSTNYLPTFLLLGKDYDSETRPTGAAPDTGADEYVDNNGNGLPDYWENYYGLAATAASDADGDGFPDINEYYAGTDPRDPHSLLRVTAIAYANDGIDLQWQSAWGKLYSISLATETTADYVPARTHIAAEAPRNTATNLPADDLQKYFRVDLEPNGEDE